MQASLEKGVTAFHDAGSSFTTIDMLKQVAAEGGLGIRLWVMVRDSNENLRAKLAQYKAVGLNDNHLTIAAIKVVADGALGSRGAWMLEPYTRFAVERRPADDADREHRGDRAHRARQRRAAVRARDRRSRQSRSAEHLRARVQAASRRRRICAGASSTRSTSIPPTSRASGSSA